MQIATVYCFWSFYHILSQVVKELESQPVQDVIDLSLQRNRQPTPTDNSQISIVSKRSSTISKPSSRKSSATASRPQSVNKVHASLTHSVLRNVNRPESKTNRSADSIDQTAAVLSVSRFEPGDAASTVTEMVGDQEERTEAIPEQLAHSDESKQADQVAKIDVSYSALILDLNLCRL